MKGVEAVLRVIQIGWWGRKVFRGGKKLELRHIRTIAIKISSVARRGEVDRWWWRNSWRLWIWGMLSHFWSEVWKKLNLLIHSRI